MKLFQWKKAGIGQVTKPMKIIYTNKITLLQLRNKHLLSQVLFLCRKLSRKRFSEDTLDKYNRIIANSKAKEWEEKMKKIVEL